MRVSVVVTVTVTVIFALACGSTSTSAPGDAGTDASRAGDDAATEAATGDDAAMGDDVAMMGDAPPMMGGNPPFGGSSNGTGGPMPVSGDVEMAGGITYRLIVPSSYKPGTATPLLVVYSGTEGGAQMTMNILNLGPQVGTSSFLVAVLDGVTYNGDGNAGATVLDDVRAKYDVDNDRTYLLGESAGTTAALKLGFHIRESFFAAYWANDVNATDAPTMNASQIGFAPWGQAGPGGDVPDATTIVGAMRTAGYRLPNPAPYNGTGYDMHGSIDQFIAALSWFPGKSRK